MSQGADVDDALRTVARLLASRHADAPRGPDIDEQGRRDALSARWEASFTQVRELTEDVRLLDGVEEIERLVRRYLSGREKLFDTRIEQGRVVDGHGDLLAQDIFCLDDGPRVLDCLEFDDRLRYVDGLDDAAFLAMDLEQTGAPEAAAFFLAQYGEYSGDPAPPSLWHHYVAYRAFVRAKVSLIQAAQGARGAETAARRLVTATLRHLRTSAVGLTLVGGLPGSGKSTLSGALADRLGVTLLSSDRLRKELAGMPVEESAAADYGEGLYTPEWTASTYAALLDRASALLSLGESVVLDATWSDAAQREAALRMAERTGADLVALHCQAPGDVSAARLSTRAPGRPTPPLRWPRPWRPRSRRGRRPSPSTPAAFWRPRSSRRWRPYARTAPARPRSSAAPTWSRTEQRGDAVCAVPLAAMASPSAGPGRVVGPRTKSQGLCCPPAMADRSFGLPPDGIIVVGPHDGAADTRE